MQLMRLKKTQEKFFLQVKTELASLTQVLEWFEANLAPYISQEVFWESQITLAEGFTNAVRHAHRDLPSQTPIEIEVILLTDALEIRIYDSGKPFDVHQKLESLRQESLNPLEKEAGRGLLFIEQLTDKLDYLRLSNGKNCLQIRKGIEASLT